MDGLVCSSVVADLHDIFTDPVWFKVNDLYGLGLGAGDKPANAEFKVD